MHSCLVTWPCYFGYGRRSFAYMYFVNMRWQTVRMNELLVTIFIDVPISVAVFKVCTMLHTLFTWYVSFGLGVLLVCVYGCHYLQQRWPILPIFVYLLFLRVGLSHYLGKRFVPNTPIISRLAECIFVAVQLFSLTQYMWGALKAVFTGNK